jgi:hypothetical protein
VDIKGQQPSILVNPLRHNGIIGWHPEKVEQSPCLTTVLPCRGRRISPDAGHLSRSGKELVTRGGVWNPGYG